ncbi:MAG: hypothetical protein CMP88_00375 [Gammaproteobacteria bacterium]|jgi:MFS family permease|nr:hypothetical protein [Gammaproteobacteria bacterium]MBR16695.1 hypothetical protein [Gammaproteobacteria bacterium]|tara:strand:- start:1250 stop:2551 length:1302 start_codon:yes stop_codon:yes gene_type:complete
MSANEESASARDFGFLLFLTLLNVMNFVDRQLLASFGNWIKPDLQLSNTEFGILTGLAFLLFYSVGGLFMGALADKYNRTRLIAIGLAFWSILTALSGAARGFVSMLIPRMLIGVGESMMTPTAMSLLSDRFPARQLGFASGFYYMGVPVGVAASLFVVAYLEPLLGWRGCFYLLGGIGVFLALIIVVFLKEPKRKQIVETSTEETRVSFKEILFTLVNALKNSPALLMTIGGGVAFHFILGAATFEQLWFVEERGFDRSEIAEITGWIGIVGGVLGNLFGGIGGDKFLAKTGMGRPMFLFWIMLIFAPLNVYFRVVDPTSFWFFAGLFVGFFQLGCFYGPTFSTVQELVPPTIRGTVVGFYIVALNLIGVVVGVTAGGWIIDALQAQGSDSAYTDTLLGFTLISLSAIPLFFFAGLRYERDKKALYESFDEA